MIDHIRRYIIPAAYDLLPPSMASEQATGMLMAIGWQESRFAHRRQVNGPARGFWQFEVGGGVAGVLRHADTKTLARRALIALAYPHEPTPHGVHMVIENNDVAAAIFARLLLWTLPGPLPTVVQPDEGWNQYLAAWRPGRPHQDTWKQSWNVAWSHLNPGETRTI